MIGGLSFSNHNRQILKTTGLMLFDFLAIDFLKGRKTLTQLPLSHFRNILQQCLFC